MKGVEPIMNDGGETIVTIITRKETKHEDGQQTGEGMVKPRQKRTWPFRAMEK